MSSVSTTKLVCVGIACTLLTIAWFLEPWVRSASGYELGNRRRVVSVIKLELLMTLVNIFIYYQLLAYYTPKDEDPKTDRRILSKWRERSSIGLLVFFFLAQLIYYMYYAPLWLQWLLFDLTSIACGIWTNLFAFVLGFWIVNITRPYFLLFPPTKCLIDLVSQIDYLRRLIFERRSQIRFTITISLLLSFVMWAGCDYIQIKERTIHVKDLSAERGRLHLAVISDIHAGASVYKKQVANVVDHLLSLDVDAVLIVGDMVDGPVSEVADRVEPMWQLPRQFPTFFVTGNHDYYYGDAMEWTNLYKKMGIHVLNNNHTLIKGVCLAGVNDISSGKMGINNHESNATIAIKYCPKDSTKILMAHNPATITQIPKIDLEQIDLILSGHTHAGQFYVVVPLVYWMLPYFYGLYELPFGGGRLMVSAGTLYQGPNMKMIGMSEIWVVNLIK